MTLNQSLDSDIADWLADRVENSLGGQLGTQLISQDSRQVKPGALF